MRRLLKTDLLNYIALNNWCFEIHVVSHALKLLLVVCDTIFTTVWDESGSLLPIVNWYLADCSRVRTCDRGIHIQLLCPIWYISRFSFLQWMKSSSFYKAMYAIAFKVVLYFIHIGQVRCNRTSDCPNRIQRHSTCPNRFNYNTQYDPLVFKPSVIKRRRTYNGTDYIALNINDIDK